MKKVNLWQSTYTGTVYETPVDWTPEYDGWVLLGTRIDEEEENK